MPENGPLLWREAYPRWPRKTHKYDRGHVAVFSGPRLRTGAARLCAQAAARSGAGAVTLLGSDAALTVHAAHVTSIMLKEYTKGNAARALDDLTRVRSVVLGPGFDDLEEARRIARHCLERSAGDGPFPLVLDADGITAFAECPDALSDLSRRHARPGLVLTPHEGEFGRLFPDLANDGKLEKADRARMAAERAWAVIIYKGADTVIACPEAQGGGKLTINTTGTPALATAGSGDVLAGIVAGLLAQRMPPFEAACAAVWIHGEAGRMAGPACTAEDLIDALKAVLPMI